MYRVVEKDLGQSPRALFLSFFSELRVRSCGTHLRVSISARVERTDRHVQTLTHVSTPAPRACSCLSFRSRAADGERHSRLHHGIDMPRLVRVSHVALPLCAQQTCAHPDVWTLLCARTHICTLNPKNGTLRVCVHTYMSICMRMCAFADVST